MLRGGPMPVRTTLLFTLAAVARRSFVLLRHMK